MKKALLITALATAATLSSNAQSLYVCSKNGTTIELPIK